MGESFLWNLRRPPPCLQWLLWITQIMELLLYGAGQCTYIFSSKQKTNSHTHTKIRTEISHHAYFLLTTALIFTLTIFSDQTLFWSSFKIFLKLFYLFGALFCSERRQKERERNIFMRKKHPLTGMEVGTWASALTWNQSGDFEARDNAEPRHTSQSQNVSFKKSLRW